MEYNTVNAILGLVFTLVITNFILQSYLIIFYEGEGGYENMMIYLLIIKLFCVNYRKKYKKKNEF